MVTKPLHAGFVLHMLILSDPANVNGVMQLQGYVTTCVPARTARQQTLERGFIDTKK